ncbi:MAG: hypothetical protein ABI388_05120 [Bacteroidia bacterium]
MRDKEFIKGDCFIYTIPDSLKSKFGFIVISKRIKKDNSIKDIHFAIVMISEETNKINEFKDGYIYTNQIPIGLSGIYETGVFCYNFDKDTLCILDEFKFIGNLKIDSGKFIVGGGTGGLIQFMLNASLKHIEYSMGNRFNKSKIEAILKL